MKLFIIACLAFVACAQYEYGYPDPDEPDYYNLISVNEIEDKLQGGVKKALNKAKDELQHLQGKACDLCTKAVHTVQKYADDDLPAIQKKLEEYCDYAPAVYHQKCVEFVDKEIPAIKNMVDNKMTAQQICVNTLHICTAQLQFVYGGGEDYIDDDYYTFMSIDDVKETVKEEIKALEDKLKNGVKAAESKAYDEVNKLKGQACSLCTQVVTTVKKNVDEDTPSLQAKLESYCKYVPAVLEQQCIDFIETELPQLRQLVDNNLTPQEICTDHLHVCSNTLQFNKHHKKHHSKIWDKIKHGVSDVAHKVEKGMKQAEKKLEDEAKKLGPILGALSCPLCQQAVEKAKSTLKGKEKKGNDKITEEICKKAPSSAQIMCQMGMKKFLPMIEKALEDNVSGDKICQDIVHLCH